MSNKNIIEGLKILNSYCEDGCDSINKRIMKKLKYRNIKIEVDGIKFDSKAEYKIYRIEII